MGRIVSAGSLLQRLDGGFCENCKISALYD